MQQDKQLLFYGSDMDQWLNSNLHDSMSEKTQVSWKVVTSWCLWNWRKSTLFRDN